MQHFEVVGPDHERWVELWRAGEREPYAHPAYVRQLCPTGAQTRCALFETEQGAVIYPFHLRPLASGHDITDAYGYGGPFTNGSPEATTFWEHFDAWASEHQVVTQFGRPSLFSDERLAWPDETQVDEHIVWKLEGTDEDLWKAAKHKVRKNVKRARRSGLELELDPAGEHLEAFLEIYYATLDRHDARDDYYFDRSFFETLLAEAPETCLYVHVRQGEKIVSTELVLRSRHHLYSFLGGTLPEAFPDRANDLLKWEVAVWGLNNDKVAYVLGGGTSPGDGIFNYKRAFCPEGPVPYRLGRRVLDAQLEQALVDARHEAEPDWEPREGWFPRYRSASSTSTSRES